MKVAPSVFLLVNHMSAESYINEAFSTAFTKEKGLLKGDFQGHVLAVDPDFDESAAAGQNADSKANEDQAESLQYPGQMRILGNLVWSELYPMMMLQSVGLENIWLQARDHPLKVYTGPTVPSQVQPWTERNAAK